MDYKTALTIIASGVSVVSYIPYFRDIFKRQTKPHFFSWFVWGLISIIAFFAQLAKGAGVGAWVTGITAITCFAVAALALSHGEENITQGDWASFIGALSGAVLWRLTKNPLAAVIMVTVVDALAFYPTFRKGFYKPFEETIITFVVSLFKFGIGLFALESFNLTTAFFPAALIILNGAFVWMILIRRRIINDSQKS